MGRDRMFRFSFLKFKRTGVISFFIIFLLIFYSNVLLGDNTNTLFNVSPKEKYARPGDILTVDVKCVPSQSIKAFELVVRFNSSVLQAINVTEGDIFDGYITFFNPGIIDNSNGVISEIYGLILGAGNVSSPGTLIHVSFIAKDIIASSIIELVDVGVTDETSYISVSVSNGMVHVDTFLPLVIDNSPSKGFTGDQFVFNATITDFDNINNLTVKVDWSHGSYFGNTSMNYAGGTYFTKTVTLDKNSVNKIYYKFYAVDSFGNSFTTSQFFVPVFDNDPPVIDSVSSSPSLKQIGKYVNISAKITDNVLINNVFLNLIYPNSYSENLSVKKNISGSFYFSNKTYNLSGLYSFYFWAMDSNNNSIKSNVYNFNITGNTLPVLSYNPTTYYFGNKIKGITDSITFGIWNSGTGTLSYTLSENSNWITSISPKTGTSTGEHDTITIKIDTSGLNTGFYTYDIPINTNAGNKIFIISINIVTPTEQLDQQQTNFQNKFTIYSNNWIAQSFKPSVNKLASIELYINKKGSPATDIVASIRNSLNGPDLAVSSKSASQIPATTNWIKFDFNDITVTPQNTYYIILRTSSGSNINYYEWGFAYYTAYTRGLFLKSSNSGYSWNEYSYYDLCFKTYGASTGSTSPVLSINPSSYMFNSMQKGITSSVTFEIWNSGTGTLSYTMSENSNWITSISPNTGTSTGEHDIITIKIDTSGLNTGSYKYDIPINSNAGSKILPISITIVPSAPLLYYNPTSYNFGNKIKGITDSKTFEIWNSGTGTLSYSLSETCSWITSIVPGSGTSTGEHDTITIKIDTTGLATGSYTYNIPINTNAGNKIFTISITIVTSTEQLDQQQIRYENKFTIYSNNWIAQSFKPSKNTLASIELYINKIGSPATDIVASIRNSLNGPDLAVSSKPASQIPTTTNWVKFDFNDITVTPENTYYIILRTNGGSSSNYYEWGFAYFTAYTRGLFCISSTSGSSWNEYSYYDLCFKTYG